MLKQIRGLASRWGTWAATGLVFGACSSEGSNPSDADTQRDLQRVDLQLNVPEGHTVASIHYAVFAGTDVDGTPPAVEEADADVSSEWAQARAQVYLAPGQYTVTLWAEAEPEDVPCSGQATFNVAANGTTTVPVSVVCTDPNAPPSGGAELSANFTFDHPTCGLTQVFVGPLDQAVNGNELITVRAKATPGASFNWQVSPPTLGSFAPPSASNTSFDCASFGPGVIRVTVANPAQACSETRSVQINCLSACSCGDGVVCATEACEPMGDPNCNPITCQFYVCGDGVVDPNELCDDGNSNDLDACSNQCVPNECGDGVVNDGEQCDPPNSANCGPTCLISDDLLTCEDCAASDCAAEVAECDDSFNLDSMGVNRCRNILSCHQTTNCSQAGQPVDCFCGTAAGTACISAPNGACLAQYLHGFPVPNTSTGADGSTLDAGLAFIDSDYAIGDANNLAACLESNCQARCDQY